MKNAYKLKKTSNQISQAEAEIKFNEDLLQTKDISIERITSANLGLKRSSDKLIKLTLIKQKLQRSSVKAEIDLQMSQLTLDDQIVQNLKLTANKNTDVVLTKITKIEKRIQDRKVKVAKFKQAR